MDSYTLSRQQVRRIILHAAGLADSGQFGTGPDAVSRLTGNLGFVQLDTNYVVERAHHLIMAACFSGYEPGWLAELVNAGHIFEYLSFGATGYLPIQDFRFSLPVKEGFSIGHQQLKPAETRLMKNVLNRVEREGPLRISDFENDGAGVSPGWGRWRPAKVALEQLYQEGKLMVTRDKGFHRVYDLPVNVISEDTDLTMPTPEEYARFVIRRSLGVLGIAGQKEMAWRTHFLKDNLVKQELTKMVAEGKVHPVTVEGINTAPLYILPEQSTAVELPDDVFILSPFDILNIFRYRLKDFFGFDYLIECYVAAAKRKYGYFCLPILIGDTFIARMDAKADRKQKLLIVHNLHFESVKLTDIMIEKLTAALKAFVRFNQCRDIIFTKSNQAKYLDTIRA